MAVNDKERIIMTTTNTNIDYSKDLEELNNAIDNNPKIIPLVNGDNVKRETNDANRVDLRSAEERRKALNIIIAGSSDSGKIGVVKFSHAEMVANAKKLPNVKVTGLTINGGINANSFYIAMAETIDAITNNNYTGIINLYLPLDCAIKMRMCIKAFNEGRDVILPNGFEERYQDYSKVVLKFRDFLEVAAKHKVFISAHTYRDMYEFDLKEESKKVKALENIKELTFNNGVATLEDGTNIYSRYEKLSGTYELKPHKEQSFTTIKDVDKDHIEINKRVAVYETVYGLLRHTDIPSSGTINLSTAITRELQCCHMLLIKSVRPERSAADMLFDKLKEETAAQATEVKTAV